MRFVLTIQLGNDAMQTGEDVARALRETATLIDYGGVFSIPDGGRIYDENGNTIGSWEVVA